MIPYGRQFIDEEDLRAVERVLKSEYLTTGPAVDRFEKDVAEYCGAKHGVAVSSGTSALHIAMLSLGIGQGDEVVVPAITFAASANCVCYAGATPVFADVLPDTLLIDPVSIECKISSKTKAILAVDYAGQPCDWKALRSIAEKHGLSLIGDSCHAIGATYGGQRLGTLADMTVFSFHPVKHVTTGEGGMVVTHDDELARMCRLYRNHGITTDSRQREESGAWYYEMTELGFNYRMTDIQAALGSSQLKKLSGFLEQRREIASQYDGLFSESESVQPLKLDIGREHAYHLYVVKVPNRDLVFKNLRRQGVGVNVHYIPVYLHPFYKKNYGTKAGDCPSAEKAFESILSLPIFPSLTSEELEYVARLVKANK